MRLGSAGWDRMIQKQHVNDDVVTLRDLTIFDQRVALVIYPADDMFAFDLAFRNVTAYGIDGDVYLTSRSLQTPSETNYTALRDSLISRFGKPTTSVSPSRSNLLPADDPEGPGLLRRRYGYDASDPDLRLQQAYVVDAWESDSVRVVIRRVDSELWRAPTGRIEELMSLTREEVVIDTSFQEVNLIVEESGRWPIEGWSQRNWPRVSNPIPGTATAKRVAFQKRLMERLGRNHPALDTLRFIGQLPLDGERGDANYPIEQKTSFFSDREYERVNIDPKKAQPFVSDLSRADVSDVDADFDSEDHVSSVRVVLRPQSARRSVSDLHRDALRLLAERFGTPDIEYVDNHRDKRGHLWYTDSIVLDLMPGDESIAIELTRLPDPTFFLRPDIFEH